MQRSMRMAIAMGVALAGALGLRAGLQTVQVPGLDGVYLRAETWKMYGDGYEGEYQAKASLEGLGHGEGLAAVAKVVYVVRELDASHPVGELPKARRLTSGSSKAGFARKFRSFGRAVLSAEVYRVADRREMLVPEKPEPHEYFVGVPIRVELGLLAAPDVLDREGYVEAATPVPRAAAVGGTGGGSTGGGLLGSD